MATLIQSKQIQGVVTASVIEGDFAVNAGSVNLAAASGVTGSFSGSFVGDGSGIQGIDYSQIINTPVFLPGNNITITSGSNIITITSTASGGGSNESLNSFTASYYTDSSSFDSRIVGISASGSGADWNTNLQNIPNGIISGSIQILGGTDIISSSAQISSLGFLTSSHTDISSLNDYTASNDLRLTNLESTTSSLDTRITQLSDTTGSYETIGRGIISSSEQFPSGIVSSSVQILGGTGILSGSHSDLSSLNTYTSSTDERLSNIEAATGSYLTSETDSQTLSISGDQLTISSGNVVTIPTGSSAVEGTISGSQQISDLGFISSSHTDVTHLNTFTSSIQTEVDGLSTFTSSIQTEVDVLSAATSSYLTSETDSQTLSIDGNELTISSGNSITLPATSLPSGVISGSSQLTSSYDARYVINQAPTAEFTNHTTNFNTNLATSGKTMVSMSVSDSEGNSPYSASLSGTDGSSFDLVYSNDASSSIGIHAGSNLSAQTYRYNVTVFDSFDKFTTYSRTLEVTQADVGTLNGDTTSYIIESANNGATIRDASGFGGGNASQVSVSYSPNHGSQVLSSFTSSNPAVLIDSSGNLTMGLALRGSTTGSGDSIVSNITFTDQYSNVGNSNVTINVFANNHPSASISDISGDLNINEATSGTDLVNVTITDTESDTPFSASLSGTHASSFQLQYNNSNSSSIDIQAASDLSAQTYSYTLDIFDNFGKTSSYDRTLTIADANVGTLSTNGTFYIIESATSGNAIRLNSNGRTGTQGDLSVSYSPNYGSQTCSEFTSSNALIAVNSSGNLSVGSNISGSGETSGDTITSNITFADQYGNVGSGSISVNVTTNNAPDIIFSNSSRLNTNQATGSSGTLTTLSFSDTESDSVDYDNLTFTDSSGQLTATQNSNTWLVTANSQLSASNYTFSAAIEDEHHFRTNTESHTITIVQSGNGTMTGDSSVYIIESAESGDPFRDATGFGNGNTAQIGASYSPSNGSPTIQSFTSSNPAILVDGSGNLTLGVDISGSVTQSGDTINSDITFTDQYGNVGSGSVTATVFGNNSPVVTFTATSNYETDNATNGSTAGTLSISDTESNSPFTITLGGTHASSFQVSGTNILANTTLSAGTYTINITVTDTYSESVTLSNQTITVTTSQDFGKIYIYYSNYGTDAGFSSNYNAVMGASTVNSDTPPEVTAYTGNTASPYYKFKSGDIGSTSISLAGSKNATLAAVVSGSNLNSAISESAAGMSWTTGVQSIILFPSGSDMGGIPSSMTDGFGGSTTGQYVLVEYPDGTSAPLGAAGSVLHSIVLDSALHGYSEWFVLGAIGQNSATTMRLKVLPSSGSLGAF